MSRKWRYCPDWSWWIRIGERLDLGLAIHEALAPGAGAVGKPMGEGLRRVELEFRRGSAVVDALRASGLVLPLEAWCLLEAGERTGRLGEALKEIGEFLKVRKERRRELVGQLWYPSLVGVTALLVMGLILLWVIPQMREVGLSMGLDQGLPWLTEHIGKLYGAAFGGSLLLIGLAALWVWLLGLMARSRLSWARFEEGFYRVIPLLGAVRRQLREGRLLRQLGTLLHGGVTLPHALELTAASSRSIWEHDQLMQWRTRLLIGAGTGPSIQGCRLIDSENAILLQVGQESGKLDTYMERISKELEQRAAGHIKQAMRFLEPLFLFFLAGAVGGLILAYLLPMIRMLEQAGGAY